MHFFFFLNKSTCVNNLLVCMYKFIILVGWRSYAIPRISIHSGLCFLLLIYVYDFILFFEKYIQILIN
jgi:hypothetical protein